MRKYRAIPINGKDFVYGWYVPVGEKCFMFGKDIITPEIFVSTKPPLSSVGVIEVIPETVGQSTGLKDKDGEDLDWWEDDLFKLYGQSSLSKIIQLEGCYYFENIVTRGRNLCGKAVHWFYLPKKIGTILTHPELKNK